MSQLKVNSIVPVGGVPTGGGGGIIQVMQAYKNDTASSSTNGSFTDISGLSVSITPISSSNKILVFVALNGISHNIQSVGFRLLRGSTQVGGASSTATQSGFANVYADEEYIMSASHCFLDSPATTSQTTSKLQWRPASGTVYLGQYFADATNYNSASTITAMEVSA